MVQKTNGHLDYLNPANANLLPGTLVDVDKKSVKIQSEVFNVTFEETGSELIALLKESEEIKINKNQEPAYPPRNYKNPINENNVSLNFQKNITLISQDGRVGATATCIVSSGGTVTSIVISDGGVGYTTTPTISISQPIGFGTTAAQNTALATATISGGVVTGIAVTYSGSGYISTSVPQVLIESPTLISESDSVTTYSGDSGVIVGFGTTTISSIDKIIFDVIELHIKSVRI